MDYNGPREENGIVNWVLKKVGPPSMELSSCEDLDAKVEGTKLALAFFGEFSGKEYETVF